MGAIPRMAGGSRRRSDWMLMTRPLPPPGGVQPQGMSSSRVPPVGEAPRIAAGSEGWIEPNGSSDGASEKISAASRAISSTYCSQVFSWANSLHIGRSALVLLHRRDVSVAERQHTVHVAGHGQVVGGDQGGDTGPTDEVVDAREHRL